MAEREQDEDVDERGLPPCLDCGRCCTGPPGWVTLAWNDLEGLGADEFERLTRDFVDQGTTTRVMRQREDGSCVALDRGGGRFVCTIYEQRPALCRLFERGGPDCRETYAMGKGG